MTNPWFKFYAGEYLSDTKILQLNGQERSCWVTLLCLANQGEGKVKFLSEQQLLMMSGVSESIQNVLKKFETLGMITTSNGIVTVRNWNKRQYSEGYSRVKKFRERKSNSKDNDRVEENIVEEIRIDKNVYGEFGKVLLTLEEYKKLIEKYGDKNTQILITQLDTGIASKGYKYKSHYATILNWARRKYTEHAERKSLQTKTRTIA